MIAALIIFSAFFCAVGFMAAGAAIGFAIDAALERSERRAREEQLAREQRQAEARAFCEAMRRAAK